LKHLEDLNKENIVTELDVQVGSILYKWTLVSTQNLALSYFICFKSTIVLYARQVST